MLGSDYRELIVPRLDSKARSTAVLIGGCALVLAALLLMLLTGKLLLLLLVAALGIGTWYLWTTQRVEYEYIISGDQLEITKILAESRRKPMITVSIKDFTAFRRLTEVTDGSTGQTLVLACSAQDDTAYCADMEQQNMRIVFTPNEDILRYLELHLPRSLNFRYEPD